jgi:hypothetical protein
LCHTERWSNRDPKFDQRRESAGIGSLSHRCAAAGQDTRGHMPIFPKISGRAATGALRLVLRVRPKPSRWDDRQGATETISVGRSAARRILICVVLLSALPQSSSWAAGGALPWCMRSPWVQQASCPRVSSSIASNPRNVPGALHASEGPALLPPRLSPCCMLSDFALSAAVLLDPARLRGLGSSP